MPADDTLQQPSRTAPRPRAPWQAVVAETLASLVACGAVVAVFLHYVGVHLTFFGAPVVVHEEDVRLYRVLVGLLALAVVASFAAAVWRRARGAFVWHALVAVVGALVALTFPVTEVGQGGSEPLWLELVRPESTAPSGPTPNSACHSGGDSDGCVGG